MSKSKRDPLISTTEVLSHSFFSNEMLHMHYESLDAGDDPFFTDDDLIHLLSVEGGECQKRGDKRRGYADIQAFKKRFHDVFLFDECTKQWDPVRYFCYYFLEKARVECIASTRWLGARDNLNCLFQETFPFNRILRDCLSEAAYIQMIYARVRYYFISSTPILERYKTVFDHDVQFFSHFVEPFLGDLRLSCHDQEAYAHVCYQMLKKMKFPLDIPQTGIVKDIEEGKDTKPSHNKNNSENKVKEGDIKDGQKQEGFSYTSSSNETKVKEDGDLSFDLSILKSPTSKKSHFSFPSLVEPQPYRVFTKRYDKVERAHARPHALKKQMTTLFEEKSPPRKGLISSLRKKLMPLLATIIEARDIHGLSEGDLDMQRLSRVIFSRSLDFYKQRQEAWLYETCVSILVDNSGSMRGNAIFSACLTSHVLSQVLELCGIQNEILGFTTGDWGGGRAKQDWIEAGSPPFPGRLNEMRYLVYKDMRRSYRHSYQDICLMLDHDVLKENIDGEALLWAVKRLMTSQAQRKILLVISDGAPVDDATLSANGDPAYAERHLRSVIHKIEKQTPIQLGAIGIGHDVTHYYKNAVTIDHPDHLVEVGGDLLLKCFSRLHDML